MAKRKMGKHKVKETNPFAGDLKDLEGYGKALLKQKYTPVVQPSLAKVRKPEALF